jgi:hypothetical protein
MKVWAILLTAYRHGQGTVERVRQHKQTVKEIANVVNIWLVKSPPFQCVLQLSVASWNKKSKYYYLNLQTITFVIPIALHPDMS